MIVSIAKALKIKNRLASRLVRVQNDIAQNNSHISTSNPIADVRKLMELREQLVTAIIDLKTAVDRKNNGSIDRDIRQLGEHKSTLSWLASISTRDGVVHNDYSERDHEYVAVIKKPEIDAMTAHLECEIDRIQDQIDRFNATTEVELSDLTSKLVS